MPYPARLEKVWEPAPAEPPPYDKPMPRWPLAICAAAIALPLLIWGEGWLCSTPAPVAPALVVAAVEPLPAPALEAPPPAIADKRAAPLTIKQVLDRADALASELRLRPSTTYTARVALRRIRRQVEANPDAAALQVASDELDAWEQRYLRVRRTEVLEAAR